MAISEDVIMADSDNAAEDVSASMASRVLVEFNDPKSHPNTKVFTSARLLQHLTAGQLLRPGQEKCSTHVFQLLPSQSGKSLQNKNIEIISCLCTECRHHFHIKVINKSSTFDRKAHPTDMHVFMYAGAETGKVLKATQAGDEFVLDRVHLVCLVDHCHCRIEVERLPPRLSEREIEDLNDKARTTRNLRLARDRSPVRYADMSSDSNAFAMLQRYISDGLNREGDTHPLRIKKHNKKFAVIFGTDFDDVFRTLGLAEREHEDGGECWFFPALEPSSSPTPFGSRRAKWEDFESELMLHTDIVPEKRGKQPAWNTLQRAFHSEYESAPFPLPAKEADMALLGCLANYQRRVFFDVARFLAEKCEVRREELLEAAERSIGDRDTDLQTELVMYRSSFDALTKAPPVSPEVMEAFKFFDTTPDKHPDENYFLNKYLVIEESDRTEAGRKRLQAHLYTIGVHMKKDLLSHVGITSYDTAEEGMTYDKASKILQSAEPDWSAEMMEGVVNNLLQSDNVDKGDVADALKLFAKFHRDRAQTDHAAKLEEWANIFKPEAKAADELSVDAKIPPGLHNIGNTCYLNSLLQYLYTVKPVRDLVLGFPNGSLPLIPDSVQQRRLGYGGGIDVSVEEAIVGRQFALELQSLFSKLQTTTQVATEPSQKLANTALRPASELLRKKPQKIDQPETKPPPLPARPSSAPPQSASQDISMVNVTVEAMNDAVETASAVSSQTLINEDEGNSTESYVEVNLPETEADVKKDLPQDIPKSTITVNDTTDELFSDETSLAEKSKIIADRLEQSDRKGTDQQDVEEIIGFILEHLMRASCSNGPMPGKEELQADAITDTFFPLFVNYTLKPGQPMKDATHELVPDRWINAFPDAREGVTSTIYEALNRSFDLQFLNESNVARFTTLRSLPPIIHIRIQRANATSAGASKNRNPVELSDELYLDRYMDTTDDSDLDCLRRTAWALEALCMDTLEDTATQTSNNTTDIAEQVATETAHGNGQPVRLVSHNSDDALGELSATTFPHSPLRSSRKRNFETLKGPDAFNSLPARRRSPTPGNREVELSEVAQILLEDSKYDTEDTKLQHKVREHLEGRFATLRKEKYRLHAVICHSGGATAGHYWVWIRDFEKDEWFKFNDGLVTTMKPQEVLDLLNKDGNPCYLAYVRDQDKQELVSIPQRAMPNPDDAVSTTANEVQMIDGVNPDDPDDLSDLPSLVSSKDDMQIKGRVDEIDAPRAYELL